MDRGTTVAYQNELAAGANTPVFLVSIAFDSPTGTIYLTTCGRSILYNGNTYLGVGGLLSVGDVQEAPGLGQQSLALQLTGVDQTYLALLLTERYTGRTITVYRALLDANGAVISDPALHFVGSCDDPVIQEDPQAGTCLLTVQAVNGGSKGRRVGRCTNSEDQQRLFPGDLSFSFVPLIERESIPWGGGGPSTRWSPNYPRIGR